MGEGGEDDDDQFESVHLLASDDIGEISEAKLADDSSGRSSDLDGSVGGRWEFSIEVDNTEHRRDQVDSKDLWRCQERRWHGDGRRDTHIIGIGEEANAGDNTGADVIPSEGSLVDLGESETTSLIGIVDVDEVVMEVVVGIVTSGSLLDSRDHDEGWCRHSGGFGGHCGG